MKKSIATILSIILVLAITFPAAAISIIPVKSIKLNNSKITMKVGDTSNLVVTLSPANTSQKKLTYVTDNKKVATVNSSGEILGVHAGNTTITVLTLNNKVFAKCNVNITSLPKAKLRFMWWGSDSRHKATLEVINQYEKANPGMKIDGEYSGYAGYFEKLTTQLSSGTEADIIQFDASMTSDLMRIGNVFLDINKMTKYIDLSGFDQTFLNNFSVYKNTLVGLPTGITAGSILVNTAVTKAAGIDISTIKTWDNLIVAGKKLHAYNPKQYFLNYELVTVGKEFIFTNLAQLTGKEVMNADFTLNFTRDDLYKVYDLIDRLYSSGTLQPAEESSPFDAAPWTNPKWISHDFAAGSLITSYISSDKYDFKKTADIIPQPMWKGAKESGIILRPAQLIGVSSNCKASQQAFNFLNYFFNDPRAAVTLKDVRSIQPTENGRKICTLANLFDPMAVKAVNIALPISTVHQNLSVPNDIVQIFKDSAAKVAYKHGTVNEITNDTMRLLKDALLRLKG